MSRFNDHRLRRHQRSPPSPFPDNNPSKKHRHGCGRSLSPNYSQLVRRSPPEENGKPPRPTFISYLETPNLSPKLRVICEIMAKTSPLAVERALEDSLLRVSQEDVEEILKLSYGDPSGAVKFLRWAGRQLGDKHSPYAWNLLVDLLGKNSLFDGMWDAIQSMRNDGLLSLATFASVFSSYVMADRFEDAIGTFEVMDQYGCARDIVALNSLFSAICTDRKTEKASDYLSRIVKSKIPPDMDTYAILLEGWETEGNVDRARQTFAAMTMEVGWDPGNVPAYDSFLCTLLKGPNGLHEAIKSFTAMRERKCTPGFRFFRFALEECVRKSDVRGASLLWEAMTMRNAITRPDTHLYNLMISLHCDLSNPGIARRFLDEMVYDGAFSDTKSYDILLRSFVKYRNLKEALSIFSEMIKNEFLPGQKNCTALIRMCLDMGDAYSAMKVCKFMFETSNYESGLEEMGDILISRLYDLNKVPEAVKYAEDMIDRRVRLSSSTFTKLEEGFSKVGKKHVYNELLRKRSILK